MGYIWGTCASPTHPVGSTPASKGLYHPAEHPPFSSSSREQRMRLELNRNPCWAALPGILTSLEENQMSVCSHPSGRKQQRAQKGEDGLGLGWKIKRIYKKKSNKSNPVVPPRDMFAQHRPGSKGNHLPRHKNQSRTKVRAHKQLELQTEAHSCLPGSERCDFGSDTVVAGCKTGSR